MHKKEVNSMTSTLKTSLASTTSTSNKSFQAMQSLAQCLTVYTPTNYLLNLKKGFSMKSKLMIK